MGKAKEIKLRVIPPSVANEFVRRYHYSGKIVPNSILHFGAFIGNSLHGVMSYGPPLDKSKVIGLVNGTGWNEMVELNRMAFDDFLPRNSESRCLAISFKLIKKNAPHIKWILSFSDGAQSGDGTIYRAAGFVLTKINPNKSNIVMPGGEVISTVTIKTSVTNNNQVTQQLAKKYGIKLHGKASDKPFLDAGGKYIPGFQLRYIYFLHKDEIKNLTCPILPFSKIDELGAGMYRGERIKVSDRKPISEHSVDRCTPVIQTGSGGAEPTCSLQLNKNNNA